ncbi:MAG: non-ribosomal peptide synthetase, partial [Deltaproteobacteria bacterium]
MTDSIDLSHNLPEEPPETTEEAYVFPMSFAQQRLWFLDQMEPGNPSYNMPAALRLRGTFSPDRLEACLNEVVARHETLRTSFGVVDGEPAQIVTPSLTLSLPIEDLGDLPPEAREGEALRRAREEAMRGFDLTRPPLLRARVLRLGDADHVLLLT